MPRSPLWQHFTAVDAEKKVTCLYCSRRLSVANKSTCTLMRHMSKKHPALAQSCRPASQDGDDADINPESPGATILEYEIDDSEEDQCSIIDQTATKNEESIENTVIKTLTEARSQIKDAVNSLTKQRKIDEQDEFDHFGLMIASKIRRIQNEQKREKVMNTVYNAVYEALISDI